MTDREIVKEAINHGNTGAVPYCISFTREAREKFKNLLKDKYMDEALKRAVEDGILNIHEANSLAIGNHVFAVHDKPWWTWYQVPDSYFKEFDAPDFLPRVKGTGCYEKFEEKIKYVKEIFGSYILVTVYGSHFEKANFCRGIENLLADLAGNREFAGKLLEHIIRKNLVMLENILYNPDIDGVLLGSDWGTQNSLMMSPDTWKALIAPGELKEYRLIKEAGKDLWIHSCGNIEQIIPDLIDMGVDVLNPVQPEAMDIYRLKDRYGDRLTFWGGISTQRTLPYGVPGEVKEETRKVISYMAKGGGYITAPGQEIQPDVPFENVLALIEEAKSFA